MTEVIKEEIASSSLETYPPTDAVKSTIAWGLPSGVHPLFSCQPFYHTINLFSPNTKRDNR